MTPFDQNLERLLREAYQPETPDPLFMASVSQRLQATARERVHIDIGERRTRRLQKILGSIAAVAALVVLALLAWRARQPWPASKSDWPMIPVERGDLAKSETKPEFLTPKPKGESPKVETLAVGKSLETGAERKRVALPDGSILFANRGSSLRLESDRRVTLEQGEIYVEVAPKDGERFVVKTSNRSVTALGTHFDVRAEEGKTSVVVTQGKVQVSGLDSLIYAGQQLLPDAERPAQAPRASALLDWARDLMGAGEALVAANKYGGGKLLAYDSAGQEAKISLRKFHLDVHIEDGFARTTIDQTYFNHESAQLEGTFYFPLPADASISRLAMYVNGMLMEGGMAEREQARNTFEQIRYYRRDPALLEWLDGSTFKMRVFPLEGRQEKRIILSYTQRLPMLQGKASYRFPVGHNLQVVDDWSAKIAVVGGARQSWVSPSHALQAERQSDNLILTDSAHGVKLDRDLQLELADTSRIKARFAEAQLDGQRYLMLRYRPELRGQDSGFRGQDSGFRSQESGVSTPHPRRFVFLFETSADRDPLLARTQIEILRTILENLEHSDTFQIVTAGTRTRLLNESAVEATKENIDASIEKLEHTQLIGAFDLENALAAVDPLLRGAGSLDPPQPPPSRVGLGRGERPAPSAWLLHLGSGIPALGERRTDVLAGRIPEGVHYAGIAVGKRWSRAFMKAAAERSGGHYTQINPDEPVQWRAFDFLAALSLGRWQNLTATDDSGRSWLLSESSLCAGEELCAAARLDAVDPLPKQVTIRGTIDGKRFDQVVNVEKVAQNAHYIPRFWGRLEIDRMLAENAEANKQKIIDLSNSLYVMSPYTSLLVLENEQMYQQFKIDRGRKDHWAMYDCPAKIDVRPGSASDTKPIAGSNDPKRELTVADVLKSIMVRNVAPLGEPQTEFTKPMTVWDLIGAPAYLADLPALAKYKVEYKNAFRRGLNSRRGLSGMMGEDAEQSISADEAFSLGFYPPALALVAGATNRYRPTVKYPRASWEYNLSQPYRPNSYLFNPDGRNVIIGLTPAGTLTPDLDIPLRSSSFGMAIPPFRVLGRAPYYAGFGGNLGASLGFGGGGFGGGGLGGFGGGIGGFGGANGFGMGGQLGMGIGQLGVNGSWQMQPFGGGGFNFNGRMQFDGFSGQLGNLGQFAQFGGYGQFGFAGHWPQYGNYYLPYYGTPLANRAKSPLTPFEDVGQLRDVIRNGNDLKDGLPARLAEDLGEPLDRIPAAATGWPMIYRVPTVNGINIQLLVRDLVAFAPGMETSWADIQATIDAEVKSKTLESGLVDDAARKLINTARASGWRSHSIKLGDSSLLKVDFDAAGRFAFDRVLPTGLGEVVICDGTTLLNLYPELGLGAKRTMSRFHRAKFAWMMPGALPPVEELALGADLKAVDAHTVAIVPHSEIQAKIQLRLIFGDDGRFVEKQIFDTAAKKAVFSETFAKLPTAKAPNLKPDTTKLVLLPLPYRTLAWAEQKADIPAKPVAKLSADEANMLIAAHFAAETSNSSSPYDFTKFVNDRFGDKAHPFGLDTLLGSCGDSSVDFGKPTSLDSNESSLRVYFHQVEHRPKQAWQISSRPGLLRDMATLHNIWFDWIQSGNRTSGDAIEQSWKRTREFIERNRHNSFGWLALNVAAPYHTSDASSYQSVAEAWQLFESDPHHGYTARYERMRGLLNGGLPQTARMVFDEMYRRTHAAGVIPPLDADAFRLPANEEGVSVPMLLAKTARDLAKKHRGFDALAIAEQCRLLNQMPAARQIIGEIEPGLEKTNPSLQLAMALFLARIGDRTKADDYLNPLLSDPNFDRLPVVWRLAADLAGQRQNSARVAKYFEKALDLEWKYLPEVLDIEALRADYGMLLQSYSQLLAAHRQTDTKPPADLAARVIKFGDRWRCVDPDPTLACQAIARVLRDLGETDRAWEYLTSPIALSPSESTPYQKLAEELKANGDNILAEKAYAAAFAAEPTNAQFLMDRAVLLQQLGKFAEARKSLQKLAEGSWQPRFDGVKNQAAWMLRE